MKRKHDLTILIVLVVIILTLPCAHLLMAWGLLPGIQGKVNIPPVERLIRRPPAQPIIPNPPTPEWIYPITPPSTTPSPEGGPQGENSFTLFWRSESRIPVYQTSCDGSNNRRKMHHLDYEFYFPYDYFTLRTYSHRYTDDCGLHTLQWFPWWLTPGQQAYLSIKAGGHLVKYTTFIWLPNATYVGPLMLGGDAVWSEGTWNVVDVIDFNAHVAAQGWCQGQTGYDLYDDYNFDRCNDVMDFQQIALNFGASGDLTVCQIWPCSSNDLSGIAAGAEGPS